MNINGAMIDCSRVLERRAYYFRLVEFLADLINCRGDLLFPGVGYIS